MKQIKVLLWFDVEDYLTPESDDAFFKLLQMLDSIGVRATLKFCTRKAAVLKERGREDILRLLPNHELSFHTTRHSVHPLPTEYLNHYGFRSGTEEFYRREKPGFDHLAAIVGQRLTSYGHPGFAWAPQAFAAVRKMGVPTYLDAHPILNVNGGPFWYEGLFTMSGLVNLIHSRHEPDQFQRLCRAFDQMDLQGEDVVFLSVYDHPTELACTEFWDEVNFARGKNPSVCRPAPLRAAGELEKNIEALRRFLLYTLEKENVEYITATEAMRYEKSGIEPITVQDLREYARSVDGLVSFSSLGGRMLCASELFSLLARSLTGRALIPELLYGPEQDEPSRIRTETVPVREIAEAAYGQFETVLGYKQLKSLYPVGENLLNPADMLCTMAEALRTGVERVPVRRGRLSAADYVDSAYRFGGNWILWEESFRAENVVEATRLQCWTLKPARV
ncbi:hypothetical protein KQI82_11200 [Oscillibacter sp. MSJ-2]|uniref:NodB homology domain-containing protein n=1 Tax=Dysosmobacter acutus TaxID=2841504 RepID=A0ABS6FDM1_9FIRM|nr:hypothetical protein [Dysosmobacter acutus]MBU5627475.1 hypothetical protein [Dysosmobacter acutus]